MKFWKGLSSNNALENPLEIDISDKYPEPNESAGEKEMTCSLFTGFCFKAWKVFRKFAEVTHVSYSVKPYQREGRGCGVTIPCFKKNVTFSLT